MAQSNPRYQRGDKVRVGEGSRKIAVVSDVDLLTGRFRYRLGKSKTWYDELDLNLVRAAAHATPARHLAPSSRRKSRKIDFENENGVKKEVCKLLDISPSDADIKRTSAPNGYGDAYRIELGHQEYYVMKDDDEFETAAIDGVEASLKDEPELFNRDFIQGHININRLRDRLHSDVYDMSLDSIQDEASHARDPIAFMKEHNIDIPAPTEAQIREYANSMNDPDKIPSDVFKEIMSKDDEEDRWIAIQEDPEIPDAALEEIADAQTNEQLKDPMSYLEDIYGKGDAVKEAIRIAGIDEHAAAEEAVSIDGAAHFMCGYDGNYETSPSGFIVWRHN